MEYTTNYSSGSMLYPDTIFEKWYKLNDLPLQIRIICINAYCKHIISFFSCKELRMVPTIHLISPTQTFSFYKIVIVFFIFVHEFYWYKEESPEQKLKVSVYTGQGYGSVIPNPSESDPHPLTHEPTKKLVGSIVECVEQYVEAMEKVIEITGGIYAIKSLPHALIH